MLLWHIVAGHLHLFMEGIFSKGCNLSQWYNVTVQELFKGQINTFEVLLNSSGLNPLEYLCDVLNNQA